MLLPAGTYAPSIHALIAALHKAGHDARIIASPAGDARPDAMGDSRPEIPPGTVCLIDLALLPALSVAAADAVFAWQGGAPHDPALRALLCPPAPARTPPVVAGSQAMAESLASLTGLAAEMVEVIAPGSAVMPRSVPVPGAVCAILCDGTLCEAPDHALLLHALARLVDLSWHLVVVVADAAEAAPLSALAAQLALGDRVQIVPSGHPRAVAAWAQADMFVLAAGWLPVAAPLLPALRHGLPVIVCADGAAGEAVPPACGAVVAAGDGVTFSKALRRMICDGDVRHKLAEASWRHAATLPDWPAQAARLVAWLRKITDR